MNNHFCFNKIVNDLDPVDFEAYQNGKEDFYAVVTNMTTGKAEYIKIDDLKKEDQMNKRFASSKNYMGFHSLITTGNIMNKDFCFNKIVNDLDPVDFETYQNGKEDFYAVVTNMTTGKAEYIKIDDLKKEDQIEYLRASGSMPFLSKPVIVHGKSYLDGGISDSIPIEKLMDMGCNKNIVVLTRP